MKRVLIVIALVFIVAPFGAFALAVIDGLFRGWMDVGFNAQESWMKGWGAAYGLLGGYFIWGGKA